MESTEFGGVEKRKHKRLSKQFVLRIQVQWSFEKNWDVVLVHNISKGGILFSYYKPLNEGMKLNLRINIGAHKKVIECVGEVLRVHKFGDPTMYQAGISFVTIDPQDAEWIEKTVEDFFAKKENQ